MPPSYAVMRAGHNDHGVCLVDLAPGRSDSRPSPSWRGSAKPGTRPPGRSPRALPHPSPRARGASPLCASDRCRDRLVPDQTPGRIRALLVRHCERHAAAGARIAFADDGIGMPPARVREDHPAPAVVEDVLEEVRGARPLRLRMGGSIPIGGRSADGQAHEARKFVHSPATARSRDKPALRVRKTALTCRGPSWMVTLRSLSDEDVHRPSRGACRGPSRCWLRPWPPTP